jgi:hypothetical protein
VKGHLSYQADGLSSQAMGVLGEPAGAVHVRERALWKFQNRVICKIEKSEI